MLCLTVSHSNYVPAMCSYVTEAQCGRYGLYISMYVCTHVNTMMSAEIYGTSALMLIH